MESTTTFTCGLCSEVFTKEGLAELRDMGERYYRRHGCFMCVDCYDNYRRLTLDERAIIKEKLVRS